MATKRKKDMPSPSPKSLLSALGLSGNMGSGKEKPQGLQHNLLSGGKGRSAKKGGLNIKGAAKQPKTKVNIPHAKAMAAKKRTKSKMPKDM